MSSSKEIKEIIHSYLEGESAPSETDIAQQWLGSGAGTAEGDRVLSDLWKSIPESSGSERSRRAFTRFRNTVVQEQPTFARRISRSFSQIAAVLFIPLLIAGGLLYYLSESPANLLQEYAAYGKTSHLVLEDGTTLHLNAGTHVIYPDKFGRKNRKIFITGEAYMDVTPDSKRPFVVDLSNIQVEVLGTQFNVKSYPDEENISVTLVEGSVAVKKEDKTLSLLERGEILSYNKLSGEIDKQTFDPDEYIQWYNGGIVFRNESLRDIAGQLKRIFDVEIVIRDNELARTRFYLGFMNNESLDEILNALNYNDNMRIVNNGGIIDIYRR